MVANKVLRAIGWSAVTAGIGFFLFCVLMLVLRSPHDFEGTIVGAAMTGIILIALPTFVVGLTLVGFSGRIGKGTVKREAPRGKS